MVGPPDIYDLVEPALDELVVVVGHVSGEEQISKARLKLVEAARIVLARCLELMIMEAPEQM